MIHSAKLTHKAALMTIEEGTLSGVLEVALDDNGVGLVRYQGTDNWLTIGNLEDEPPATWTTLDELIAAVEAAGRTRDAAGNVVPFEA